MVYAANEAIFDIDSEFVNFGYPKVGKLYINAELFVNKKSIEAF